MASTCQRCGRGLSFTQRARGRILCDDCSAKSKAELAQALGRLESALTGVVHARSSSGPAVDELRQTEVAIVAAGGQPSDRKAAYYKSVLDAALVDEVLTEAEERDLMAVGEG